MKSLAPSVTSGDSEPSRALLAELLAQLHGAQNADGGWPFLPGVYASETRSSGALSAGTSRVEPTCWALLALGNLQEVPQETIARGVDFLKSQQLSDGSWPTATGMTSGGWVTSLAALTLAQISDPGGRHEKSVASALEWLCDDYPRDSSRWQKFLKFFNSSKCESLNGEFRGWGWTPRTASWVEPTSFALMAFAAAANLGKVSESKMSERRTLGVGLLYDRTCASGGWNCGNPRVYGVDGDSLVLPTCWALLALRDAPDHPNRTLSLAWLQKSFTAIASAGSLAVARMTLENHGVAIPAAKLQLMDFSAADLAGQGTHVTSWVALALNGSRSWPVAEPRNRDKT
jgi:squalene-hopene cyclase-like protein